MHIQCSHRKFNFYGLFNEEYGMFLNAKGHNARVISEWLLNVVHCVRTQTWPGGQRTLGTHIVSLLADDRLYLSEVALILSWCKILHIPQWKLLKSLISFLDP